MNYRDPAHDFEKYSQELERAASNAKWFVRFEDLSSESIEVDGTKFNVKVDACLSRDPQTNDIEIHSIEFSRDIYVELPGHCDFVKLDRDAYVTTHKSNWRRVQNHYELLAMTKALTSKDWEQEDV